METSNLKNMVVLKNLPSNIVDEAIIVLKANKKTKKLKLAVFSFFYFLCFYVFVDVLQSIKIKHTVIIVV